MGGRNLISIETFFGRSRSDSVPSPGALYLSVQLARFWRLTAASAGRSVRLPDFTSSSWVWTPGVPHFLIFNAGSNSINVDTFSGSLVYALPAGEAVEINLRNNSTAVTSTPSDWQWDARKRLKMS